MELTIPQSIDASTFQPEPFFPEHLFVQSFATPFRPDAQPISVAIELMGQDDHPVEIIMPGTDRMQEVLSNSTAAPDNPQNAARVDNAQPQDANPKALRPDASWTFGPAVLISAGAVFALLVLFALRLKRR